MKRPSQALVLVLAALAMVPGATAGRALAQQPGPGFTAHGTLGAQTQLSGQPISLTGNIALEQLGDMVRLDLLSLGIPNSGSVLGALASSAMSATSLFPAGGYSVVFDRRNRTYTVWSPSKRTYFASAPNTTPAATSNPAVAATTAIAETGDLLHSFAAARVLRDYRVFSASINLTGHGTTNGHPTTGLSYAIKRQERSGDLMSIAGSMKLADDLDEIPVQLIANVQGAGGGAPPGTIRVDLTSIDRNAPSGDDFSVPAGFTRAAQLSDVFGRALPQL
jgi:hypothetical protein